MDKIKKMKRSNNETSGSTSVQTQMHSVSAIQRLFSVLDQIP